jgi:glycosyltransferase involved in cell wall biosynthesis
MSVLDPWHISVLIPARNEEALLPRCLLSVLTARSLLATGIVCDIVLVADRSTDSTIRVAKGLLKGVGTVIQSRAGRAGSARKMAAAAALKRYRGPRNRCWFANTDADCVLPATWLVDQLRMADAGAEAVAGIVSVDSFADHERGVAEGFHRTYLTHPDGSHPHVHGANLGVRADAYLRSGGWSDLETAEDHDLWGRLSRAGATRVSSSRLTVITSGRRVGRAPHGFAAALAAHGETAR